MDSLVVYHNSLPAQTVVRNIETINTNQNGHTDENWFPSQLKFALFSPLLPLLKNTEMANFHCRDNIAAYVTGMAGGIPLGRHGCHLWDGTTSIYHNCPWQLSNPLSLISCRATTAISVRVKNSDILYPRKLLQDYREYPHLHDNINLFPPISKVFFFFFVIGFASGCPWNKLQNL